MSPHIIGLQPVHDTIHIFCVICSFFGLSIDQYGIQSISILLHAALNLWLEANVAESRNCANIGSSDEITIRVYLRGNQKGGRCAHAVTPGI